MWADAAGESEILDIGMLRINNGGTLYIRIETAVVAAFIYEIIRTYLRVTLRNRSDYTMVFS